MRIGSNPVKSDNKIILENYHRVIIPVYIPNFEGYFKDSLQIFKFCLESLLKTIHTKTRITIYSNNCHPDVDTYISMMKNKYVYIDQVFYSKINMGKINAILASVAGNLEPLITISDSDVLFLNNWQDNVEKVFTDFPQAGMVSPVPNSKLYKGYTNANWFYGIFNRALKFEDVSNPDAMEMFYKSIGADDKVKKIYFKKYLTIKNKQNSKAVVGCGHFVATLRREVFDFGTSQPAFIKIQGGVEGKFIDEPNQSLGFLRLATLNNYAFHLGNTLENWMEVKFNEIKPDNKNLNLSSNKFVTYKQINPFGVFFGKVFVKFILRSFLKNKFFQFIGLTKEEAKHY